ncbi:MAG: phosphatase PAP2 family protein [Chitinophagales bacterium]
MLLKTKHKHLTPLWLIYALFFILGALLLLIYPKGDIVLLLHEHHSIWKDFFFKYITFLGDGALFGILLLLFWWNNKQYIPLLIGVILVQTIIVQGMKRFVFAELLRPKGFFENTQEVLHFVEGVSVKVYHTFPSGHTATAFAIATLLALIMKKQAWSICLAIFAILVGISRIYLAQHFLVDVFFGSMIGILTVLLLNYIYPSNP